MKPTSKTFLLTLFLCCSQTIMSMEDNDLEKYKKEERRKHKQCMAELPSKDARRIFDEVNKNPSFVFDWGLATPTKTLTNIEERLEKIRQKTNIVQEQNNQHKYYAIIYDGRMRRYCYVTLKKIIKETNDKQKETTLLLTDEHNWFRLTPNNQHILLGSSPYFHLDANFYFVNNLSLEAQEAWFMYLVHIAMNRNVNFSHDKILSDKLNKKLFIALAAKNEENTRLFDTLITEAVDLPIDLYIKVKTIKNCYTTIAWLKKYAV